MSNRLKGSLSFFFFLLISWWFVGQPKIQKNPPIPPPPKSILAASPDFLIQRGVTTIAGGQTVQTLTAGTGYTAPSATSKAFVRIVSTRLSGAGSDSSAGNHEPDMSMTYIDNTDITSSIVFKRFVADGDNTRITYEIIEYTGAASGGNEIIVRDVGQTIVTSTTATPGVVSGISDDNAVAVFITGQASNSDNKGEFDRSLFTSEWLSGSDQPKFTRGDGTETAYVSYAVVEFTGTNWRDIQRESHSYAANDTTEYETIDTTLLDTSKTFLHVQTRSTSGTLDEQSGEAWLSSTTQVAFFLQSGASLNPTNVVWIIENTASGDNAMAVNRYNSTRSSGSEPYYEDLTITTVDSMTNTSIWGESARSTGAGTNNPRGNLAFELTDTSTVQLFTTDNGQTQNYRYEIVEWPTSSVAVSISLNTDGSLAFGTLALGTTKDTTSAGINDTEIVSVDSGPADLEIRSADFTEGGNTWFLNSGNGTTQVQWQFSKNTGVGWTTFVVANSLYGLEGNVSQGETRPVDFELTMPTTTDSYGQYSTTVTIQASAP